jgi:hypothetical protein
VDARSDIWDETMARAIGHARDYALTTADQNDSLSQGVMEQISGREAQRAQNLVRHMDKDGWGVERDIKEAIKRRANAALLGGDSRGGGVSDLVKPALDRARRIAAAHKRVIVTNEEAFMKQSHEMWDAYKDAGLLGAESDCKELAGEMVDASIHWRRILVNKPGPWDASAYKRAHWEHMKIPYEAPALESETEVDKKRRVEDSRVNRAARERNAQAMRDLESQGKTGTPDYAACRELEDVMSGKWLIPEHTSDVAPPAGDVTKRAPEKN